MIAGDPQGSRELYGPIAFGDAGDPFLVNAAPRLIDSAVGDATAKFLVFISIVGQFFCGMASVTANSRMIYAFSRDGALPGSKYWHQINPKTRTPTNSVWLGVGAGGDRRRHVAVRARLGSRSLLDGVLRDDRDLRDRPVHRLRDPDLPATHATPISRPGPWNLKGYHKLVGWTSIVWIGLITMLFFAPLFRPFWPIWGDKNLFLDDGEGSKFYRQNNFNFTGPLIVLPTLPFWLYWQLSGRKWFNGPKVQGTPEELRAIERELDALEHGRL